jgi:hypothetical protein
MVYIVYYQVKQRYLSLLLLVWSSSMNHYLLFVKYLSPVEVGVVERALICSMALLFLAELCLVVQRMVFKLFPAMTLQAASLEIASLLVGADEGSSRPIFAELLGIDVEDMRLSPKVLPIMGVVTLGLVVFLIEQAPFGLEIEHVKILVFLHGMNDPGLKVRGRVSK